jgi:hypothetical protein
VINHGVVPSQIRTLLSGFDAVRSSTPGGGANGQLAALGIGYSGISGAVSFVLPVRISDMIFVSFLDVDGHRGAELSSLRTLSARSTVDSR